MAELVATLTVTLDKDYRDNDAEVEGLLAAIMQLRGVHSVRPGDPVFGSEFVARQRMYQQTHKAFTQFMSLAFSYNPEKWQKICQVLDEISE